MLTPEQAARVDQLATDYETQSPPVSFADWLLSLGEADLLTALEQALREAGELSTLDAIHVAPVTPESQWQKYVEEFDAPTEGGPWALNKAGRWFAVSTEAPGGKVAEFQNRLIYVPPQHPSVRVDENGGYGGRTDNELRWSEQKFRMARAALLRPNGFHNLFWKVAPRGGGPMGAGRSFQSRADDYDSEGGELYPDLKPSDAEARTLNEWWRLQDFGGKYTGGYEWGQTLNWLRVYTGADGYRHYKPWTASEMRDYLQNWMLAAPGYVCRPDELERYEADGMNLQRERQAAQTEGDYSLHWAWPIGPLAMCQVQSSTRRMKNLRKIAAIAAIVVTIMYAPQIAAKLKTFLSKIGPKLMGAAKSAGGSLSSALLKKDEAELTEVERQARAILTDPETQAAVARGELPPAPTSTADPNWSTYAQTIAQWYMQRQLEAERAQITDARARAEAEAVDNDWMRQSERALMLELDRARRGVENVAAGADPDDAAAEFATMKAGANAGILGLVAAGLGAAILLGGNSDNAKR